MNNQEPPEEIEIDLREYFYILWRRKMIILSVVLISMLAAYFIASQITPEFKTSAQILIEEEQQDLSEALFEDSPQTLPQKPQIYQEIIRSQSFLERVSRSLNEQANTGWKVTPEELAGIINVETGSVDSILVIEAVHAKPSLAQIIANTVTEELQERHNEIQISDLERSLNFLSEQAEEMREEIAVLEARIASFEDEEVMAEGDYNEIVESSEVPAEQIEAQRELEQIRVQIDLFEELDQVEGEEYEQLREREEELEEKVALFSGDDSGGSSPTAGRSIRFSREELEIAEQTYAMLREKQEEIRIQKNIEPTELEIINHASLPDAPISPRVNLLVAISGILAGMVSVGGIFTYEAFDNRIKTKEELESMTELPVLGIIPESPDIKSDHRAERSEKDEE